jgi:hypothetical protein
VANKNEAGHVIRAQPHFKYDLAIDGLALSDPEHFGSANRAHPLRRWFAVLHGDGLGIIHISLGLALHTIRLHLETPHKDMAMIECGMLRVNRGIDPSLVLW